MQNTTEVPPIIKFIKGLLNFVFSIFVICSAIWLSLVIWFQQPFGFFVSCMTLALWVVFVAVFLFYYYQHKTLRRVYAVVLYIGIFILSLIWYFSIPAEQNRDWDPEVEHVLKVQRHGDLVTLENVRNFNWRQEHDYDARWETRTVNLDDLTGVNIITSYWMGPQIAHTLVSFDFKNEAPLVFSLETRKKRGEGFSAIGGFFRKFELSLIAADEKDIIYTRSNVRHEQVYFFPLDMPKAEMRGLFEEYLLTAKQLEQKPSWYNTLTSNCTTLVFDMAQVVSKSPLPLDYRLLVSGYLPNYLYDLHALDQKWSIKEWYQQAHINPKTNHLKNPSSKEYSQTIRQGLPNPIVD